MVAPVTEAALRQALSGQRVLLTGHTGFKGTWLTVLLRHLGADVFGYALPPEPDALYSQPGFHELCPGTLADLADYPQLSQVMASYRPTWVLHLAAQALVLPSYMQPVGTFMANTVGTLHVLEALRHYNQPCVAVIITTDKVYENREWPHPYREADALGGHDPYSASKAAAEIVIQSYQRSFFSQGPVRVASARAGNVIGGGDRAAERLLPDAVRALTAGQPLVLRRPHAVRPWQHVLEPLVGYLALGAALAAGTHTVAPAYNFGPPPQDAWPVERMARYALSLWGTGTLELNADPTPHEAGRLMLDASLAITQLGWRPCLSVDHALQWTLHWEKHFHGGALALQLCQQQVQQYLAQLG